MKAVPLLCVGFLLVGSAVLANRHESGNYSTTTKENMSSQRDDSADRYNDNGTEFAVSDRNAIDEWNRMDRDPAYNSSHFIAGRDRDDYDYWYDNEDANAALTNRELEESDGRFRNASMEDQDRDEDAYEPAEWVDRSAERVERDRKHDAVYLGWNADSRYAEHHPSREAAAHVDPRAPEYSWPATDMDDDGVYDRLDHCPNTPPETAVDACGCPMETTSDRDIVSVAAYPPGSHGDVKMAILRRGTFSLDMAFFDTDRSVLRPEAEDALRQVADVIRGYPTLKFQVGGHADSRGSEEHNQDLSEARAQSVRNFLVWECGVRDLQLSTHGYGERHLSTAERDGDELQANRRVDFRVVNPEAIPRGSRPVRMGSMETLSAQRTGGPSRRSQEMAVRQRRQ
jgi:outer membrane protein OmpA-like peptidoglycan-associated protein